MRLFRRKPRIDDFNYGKLMASFGRAVDRDPFIAGPAEALAQRVLAGSAALATAVDAALYEGAAAYHLRLLAGSWLLAAEGGVPVATAEVFEEAVAWKLGPTARGAAELSHRVSRLARGEMPREGGV